MKHIGKIIVLARPLYRLVAFLSFLILLGAVLSQVAPLLSKQVVDAIMAKLGGQNDNSQRLYYLIATVFGVQLLGAINGSVSERLGDHFSGKLRKYLMELFYDHVLRLPQSYFDSEMSGKITNQLNRGISTIENFMRTSTNFILPMLLQSIFTIGVLSYYNWLIGLLVFILFPTYIGISYFSVKKWGRFEEQQNKLRDTTYGRIQEVLLNIKLVKTFTSELSEWKFISGKFTEINKLYAKQSQTFHLYDFLRNLSLIIVLLGVNLTIFRNTFRGLFTIGEMVLLLQLVDMARMPLFGMSFILTQIQAAESGAKEFFEVLALPATENYKEKPSLGIVKKPRLSFTDVAFSYGNDSLVLQNVSFELKSPTKVALVGHSGAGKSTVVNLIMKLYEATSGNITLNGKSYTNLSHADVRSNISLVLQDNELFSTTIRDNVAYGLKNATDAQIEQALTSAQAWEFVSKFPEKLDAQIGERGVRLSGGQKQRIQIARAILSDLPILILDEATSSLDAKSEKLVQDALEKLMEERLTIIIAHRFSTIQNVDHIIVLDSGKIVDQGTPAELARRKGVYQDLLRYQVEGNEKLLQSYGLVG